MNEEPYSKRELDEKFGDLKSQLDRIEEQTKKTNGSVASIMRWRERATGGTGVFLVIILPILGWALYQIAILPQSINDSVQQALQIELSNYKINNN